jgi:hypothetical protein
MVCTVLLYYYYTLMNRMDIIWLVWCVLYYYYTLMNRMDISCSANSYMQFLAMQCESSM